MYNTIYTLLFLVAVYYLFFYRKVSRYEYLVALRTNEWRTGQVIRKELFKKNGVWVSMGLLYRTLDQLERDDDLVDHREVVEEGKLVQEFRLTQVGLARKSHRLSGDFP